MTLRKTLLAATIAALPLMMSGAAQAAAPAGNPAMQANDTASMVSQLMSQRGRNGLDSRHGYAVSNQHPGAGGTTISRLDHTYKGVRVFNSESVVVTGARGNLISESASDRRNGLAKGDFNVAPGLSAKAAIDSVVARTSPNGKHIDPPFAELIIYPIVAD